MVRSVLMLLPMSVHCTSVLPLLNVAAEKEEEDERNRSEMYTAAVPDYT